MPRTTCSARTFHRVGIEAVGHQAMVLARRGSGHRPRRAFRGLSGTTRCLIRGHGPLPQRIAGTRGSGHRPRRGLRGLSGTPRCLVRGHRPLPQWIAGTRGSGHRPRRGLRGLSGIPRCMVRGHGPLLQGIYRAIMPIRTPPLVHLPTRSSRPGRGGFPCPVSR